MNATAKNFTEIDTTSSRSTEPVQEFSNFRRQFELPVRRWEAEVLKKINEFMTLRDGWDSYGAPAPSWDAGMFALHALQSIMTARTPIPQVVPTSVGGIQIEWHEKGIDFEIHVTAAYDVRVWFEDHTTPNVPPLELELKGDFDKLSEPIRLLTTR